MYKFLSTITVLILTWR